MPGIGKKSGRMLLSCLIAKIVDYYGFYEFPDKQSIYRYRFDSIGANVYSTVQLRLFGIMCFQQINEI